MENADDGEIRISDAERDEAVTALGAHMSTGRLTLAEYEDRCSRALAARTRGELEQLFGDLPAPHPDLRSATRPAQLVRSAGRRVRDANARRGSDELVATPASAALGFVAALSLFLGIPAAILLTVVAGVWWVFIPVGVVLIVAGASSEAAKKPKPGT
ncbi:DUF1707 SHOCT-like domain-containing protein [Prauserella muralis]|uniref:DUF1707 domain-containing protein n=1 Tax=Prauserella muralis TaxID=588067 RepID=A0A2V4AYD7_9PSEU|nr:DUF1707 domain-containing protein [Prauserella muralis]PXY26902.1 hypothetical protein BAY60_10370 [Prauserella muralis]TWE23491.1 uncharacterized protein DUF1707 [Prauserella muralis]